MMRLTSAAGRIRLGQVMLTLTAVVLMLVALAFFRPSEPTEVDRASLAIPPVVVSEVGVQPFDLAVRVVGRVSPWREVALAAEVGGRIAEVAVDIGDRVRAGQLVLRIETDNYETAMREAEAAELRAQARLEESEAALDRSEQLRQRGAISEREYEAALATQRAAQADLRTAEAGLERARRNLEDTGLTAPFSGTIVERHVDVGALVAGDRALVVLADLDTVAVEVGLTEREILLARSAESAIVTGGARPGEPVSGVVDGVAERADPATGTYLARIRVENAERRFLGGMVVDVEIPYAKLDAVLTVPAAALLETADGAHVFVVDQGAVRRVDVEVVVRRDDRVGVRPTGETNVVTGDLVVIVGQSQLADGDAVQVVSQR